VAGGRTSRRGTRPAPEPGRRPRTERPAARNSGRRALEHFEDRRAWTDPCLVITPRLARQAQGTVGIVAELHAAGDALVELIEIDEIVAVDWRVGQDGPGTFGDDAAAGREVLAELESDRVDEALRIHDHSGLVDEAQVRRTLRRERRDRVRAIPTRI